MTGHWIFTIRNYPNGIHIGEYWRCSECNCTCLENSAVFPSYEKFCHNCGAEMAEEPKLYIKEIPNKQNVWAWEEF